MAAAAILKNRKITISRPQLDRFRRNSVWLRSSTLLTAHTVKKLKFRKSKMAEKNRHISAAVGPTLTKFGMVKHFDLMTVPTVKNVKFLKAKMTAALS